MPNVTSTITSKTLTILVEPVSIGISEPNVVTGFTLITFLISLNSPSSVNRFIVFEIKYDPKGMDMPTDSIPPNHRYSN